MVAGADIVALAAQQVGDEYQWARAGPAEFDCSGLVRYVFGHFGIDLPHYTGSLVSRRDLQPVDRSHVQTGDLVFFRTTRGPSSHVGIYAGNGQMIEAKGERWGVVRSTLDESDWARVDAIRRVPGVDGAAGTGVVGSIVETAAGIPAKIAGWIPNPGNVTDALNNLASAGASIAESAANVGVVSAALTRAFLPTNLLRGAMLFLGLIFILIGIWFLAMEIKDS